MNIMILLDPLSIEKMLEFVQLEFFWILSIKCHFQDGLSWNFGPKMKKWSISHNFTSNWITVFPFYNCCSIGIIIVDCERWPSIDEYSNKKKSHPSRWVNILHDWDKIFLNLYLTKAEYSHPAAIRSRRSRTSVVVNQPPCPKVSSLSTQLWNRLFGPRWRKYYIYSMSVGRDTSHGSCNFICPQKLNYIILIQDK